MQTGVPSLLTRILAVIGGVILLVAGLMFSLVILAVIAVGGLAAWGWFWWKTRELRKAMQQRPAGGHVIDGEAIVVADSESVRIVQEIQRADKTD